MLTAERIGKLLSFIMIGNSSIECNFCSEGDYIFGDDPGDYLGDLGEAVEKHIRVHHPTTAEELGILPGVTHEEVLRLFGLQSEH